MEGFTFCRDYFDTLKKIKRKQDREALLTAIVEFVFEDKEPMELSEVASLAFEIHRNSLEISKKRSECGKSNGKQKKIKRKAKENQMESKNKKNEDLLAVCSDFDFLREKELPTKEFPDKEKGVQKENTPLETYTREKESIPPFYSPQGEKKNKLADEFFAKYPRYAKDRAKFSESYDFKRLLEEFEKSSYLRSLYTAKQIIELYPCIVTGDFRDKEQTPTFSDGFDARVKRERWYALRREKAISQAEKVRERFMQDETFAKIHKRLSVIEIEQAKAECQGDKQKLAKLEQEKNRLRLQKRGIIERNGLTEEDLEPKWSCRKCQDTGFVNGVGCDCYEG